MSHLFAGGECGKGAVFIVNAPMDWKFADLLYSAALPQLRLRIFKISQTVGRRVDRVRVRIRRISGGVNRRRAIVPGKPRRSGFKFSVVSLTAVVLVPVKL